MVDGITFDSKREAARYLELRLLERSGAISNLRLQPKFELHVAGQKVCRYVADFAYLDSDTLLAIVEDVKGIKTPVYRLKAKMLKAEYGITVRET